jgi:hypothetical protein
LGCDRTMVSIAALRSLWGDTRMNGLTRRTFLSGWGAAVAFVGCSRNAASDSGYRVLRDDGEPLRAAFNRAANNVRILVLVSPT